MKKAEQAIINKAALEGVKLYKNAVAVEKVERLYTCKAYVQYLDNCIALVSYNTLVAVFDRESGKFYDVLRYTYGYTSTSAQHIAKFRNLFRSLITCEYRYYPI